MPQTKLHELAEFGQSIWLDYISREMIEGGELQRWLDQGLRGLTSNPSIFNQAISKSTEYDERIAQLKEAGKSVFEIYDELTTKDIRDALDIFKPVYESTQGLDGYVSLEINPQLAHNEEESIKEGKRLFEKVNRPNLMIKVPATKAGFPVIEALLADGINVNATLIFSREQYRETAQAFLKGVERLSQRQGDLTQIRSVASVFISRIDTMVDQLIDEKAAAKADETPPAELQSLKGKAAVANTKLIFEMSRELFADQRFQDLEQKGAARQRVLWGSTSTKNPEYNDVKYVEELIARQSVNTVPEKTLKAFLDHGVVKEALNGDPEVARDIVEQLQKANISMDAVCSKLLDEGVAAFEKAFEELMTSIETKARQLCARP